MCVFSAAIIIRYDDPTVRSQLEDPDGDGLTVGFVLRAPDDDDHLVWMYTISVESLQGEMPQLGDLKMNFGTNVQYTKIFPYSNEMDGGVYTISFTEDEVDDFRENGFHSHFFIEIEGEMARTTQKNTMKGSHDCGSDRRNFRVGKDSSWDVDRYYNIGDKSIVESDMYECVQKHVSALDIQPPNSEYWSLMS